MQHSALAENEIAGIQRKPSRADKDDLRCSKRNDLVGALLGDGQSPETGGAGQVNPIPLVRTEIRDAIGAESASDELERIRPIPAGDRVGPARKTEEVISPIPVKTLRPDGVDKTVGLIGAHHRFNRRHPVTPPEAVTHNAKGKVGGNAIAAVPKIEQFIKSAPTVDHIAATPVALVLSQVASTVHLRSLVEASG